MKKFFVPVDFSETSENAAKYAVNVAREHPGSELIIYHVYSNISLSSLTDSEDNSRQKENEQELKRFTEKLHAADVNILSVAEEGSLVENISVYVMGNNIDMIIMGITGSSRMAQVLLGTNTLNVARSVNCPVMIVPPKATYNGIKRLALTSDFEDVARTTPFATIKKVLGMFQPELHILNVDEEHFIELSSEYKIERRSMEEKLKEFNPEFSFIRAYDFVDGINTFVESRQMDALMTLPRKHGFLSQLFKISHTKELAYHSTVPIIAIPELALEQEVEDAAAQEANS